MKKKGTNPTFQLVVENRNEIPDEIWEKIVPAIEKSAAERGVELEVEDEPRD